MNIKHRISKLVAVAVVATTVTSADAQRGRPGERLAALGRAVEQQLASMNGRQIYIMTDKPLYHPGETIWFRAWETAVKTLEGTPGEHGITFQLLDPRGAKVAEKRVLARGGTAANDFAIGADLAGGAYVLRAVSDQGITEDRAITISTYEAPRIKKTVDFTKASYAAGDEVTARVKLEAPTGEALANVKATAVVSVDGAEIARLPVFVDDKGRGIVRFQLPRSIARGDGLITLLVDGGGFTESIQRRIPIALDQVTLTAYPEGGDLVTGLPSRVYVAARDAQGSPVEAEGEVVDDRGAAVIGFRTFHAGMARFPLTPAAGRTYSVRLVKPKSAVRTFAIPAAQPSGCTMRTIDDFGSAEPDLRIKVHCTQAGPVLAVATLREQLASRAWAHAGPGAAAVMSLPVERGSQGAVRVTLFDLDHRPLAERLVYRGLGADMKVSIKADRAAYAPRDKVTLTVETRDSRGRPVPADVALAVVDDTVLRFAGDKTGHILAQTYLEPEMPGQKIEDANYYFSKDPKAPEAMDLLLGTQGWRRFAWKWVR